MAATNIDAVLEVAKITSNTYNGVSYANEKFVLLKIYPTRGSTVNVTYGENYTLPVPTNSYGAFRGWYYGDEKVTDATGKSLAPYAYTSNITLTTNWIEEISTAEQLKAFYGDDVKFEEFTSISLPLTFGAERSGADYANHCAGTIHWVKRFNGLLGDEQCKKLFNRRFYKG